MDGISDIKITGIDSKRPPVTRKQPYIDLYFQLSHKVPRNWAEDFNALLSSRKIRAKIQPDEGLYIETWVRGPDDVVERLKLLNSKIAECNESYIAKVLLRASTKDSQNSALENEGGEQGRLNRIVSSLEFEA